MEFATNPGRLKSFCFRKREIEKHTRKLLSTEGVTQVIVLGAGLDVLSLRLAQEYPTVNFIEIDTEESQIFKTNAFRRGKRHCQETWKLLREICGTRFLTY